MDIPMHALDPDRAGVTELAAIVGGELAVSVPDHYSSGYLWDVIADRDAVRVCRRREESAPPHIDDPVPGGSGSVVYLVRALAAGEHRVRLDLRRPWEDAPIKSLDVTVRAVRPGLID